MNQPCIPHVFTCSPHPTPPSHLPLHPIPLGLPSAPGPSTCLMHPAWLVICFTLDNIHVSRYFNRSPFCMFSVPKMVCAPQLAMATQVTHRWEPWAVGVHLSWSLLECPTVTLAATFRMVHYELDCKCSLCVSHQILCDGHTVVGTDQNLHPEQAEPCVPSQAPLRDSLLDAVESYGAAAWTGVGVRVVVQRVYSLPCRSQQADSTDPPRARWVTDMGAGPTLICTEGRLFLEQFPHHAQGWFFFGFRLYKNLGHLVWQRILSTYSHLNVPSCSVVANSLWRCGL